MVSSKIENICRCNRLSGALGLWWSWADCNNKALRCSDLAFRQMKGAGAVTPIGFRYVNGTHAMIDDGSDVPDYWQNGQPSNKSEELCGWAQDPGKFLQGNCTGTYNYDAVVCEEMPAGRSIRS